MVQAGSERNLERESWEQRRYALLEQVYLFTGENCEHPVSPGEIESELSIASPFPLPLVEDLVRLGYIQYGGTAGDICITEKGIGYLQRDAWRRRSIRD